MNKGLFCTLFACLILASSCTRPASADDPKALAEEGLAMAKAYVEKRTISCSSRQVIVEPSGSMFHCASYKIVPWGETPPAKIEAEVKTLRGMEYGSNYEVRMADVFGNGRVGTIGFSLFRQRGIWYLDDRKEPAKLSDIKSPNQTCADLAEQERLRLKYQ